MKSPSVSDHDDRSRTTGSRAASACSEEPIHIPGAIQPHGVLLAIDPLRGFVVVAASRNAEGMLANPPLPAVIGRDIGMILGADFAAAMRHHFQDGNLRETAPWQSTLRLAGHPAPHDVRVHAHAGLILVELEQTSVQDATPPSTALHQLREAIIELRAVRGGIEDLARVATRGVRLLTGFDRVLIYRFDADWNGESMGEDKIADWEVSLNGLTSPASNVPAQARELYRRSPMRWVPDGNAVPVPLDIDPAWASDRPSPCAIDLSFACLRSPSPKHLQFQRSMGISGSMSLSILHEGRLWGLIVCHHRQPHGLSVGQRDAAAVLTEAFALRVGLAERAAKEQARRGDLERLSALLAHMAQAESVAPALTTGDTTLNSLFQSTGAAVIYDGDVTLVGHTPPEAEIRMLAVWLRAQTGAGWLFQTNNLAASLPSWQPHTAVASGLLAVFLAQDRSDMLLWFRPEERRLVSWGGNPYNGVPGDPANPPGLSFERWTETRQGVAKPWAEWELEIAESLRQGLTEVIIRGLRRIAELNDRLRQSQKMEAVGQLTGGIAHDFNNLLTGIIGNLDLLRMRMARGQLGDLDRFITAAVGCANRAASLTHRLLAFSRRQMLEPRPIDVNQLTASMDELIRRTVGPGIHLETVMSGGLWKTCCDANQLENALLNLAVNARDAMPDGGRLTIEASNLRLDDAYASVHPEVAAGEYVAVSVTDTGTGMDADMIARVFEPFFTTKPVGQGTGLGLSMVYGFARQSNGFTGIYSEVGRGTTVRIYLPRFDGPDVVEPGRPDPRPDTAAKAGETILVVDDEPAVRMLLSDVLQDLGYGVIEAADGPEALGVVESEQRIDLLVTDVGLPGGMDGRQLADAARVRRPGLKVLFVTGYAENAALGNGVLTPGMQVITKPFTMDTVTAKIRSMM